MREELTLLSPVQNASIMVIGTAGPLPTAPSNPITFLEDMDDSEIAMAVSRLPTFHTLYSQHLLLPPSALP
jgi:hypothetical protein